MILKEKAFYALSLATGLCLATVAGCGSSDRPELASVTGKLTKDGIPYVNARVEFHPTTSGGTSYGTTDDNGEFELRYSTGEPGAAIDTHSVTVIGGQPKGGRQPAVTLPDTETIENAAEGALAPMGDPTAMARRRGGGGPKEVSGLKAVISEGGDNHVELTLP
ncbi:carboxypeptidase regulatory-like domain-containing protein [Roseiconus nitratireducens]|uniref:Carboxypeptidase regulatory-like domain-containing protein n=1 Tax=Roseiconus nitratireducens TaxID=2605748 RepID=A0A5M6CY96_9BACT|nr:carboxypeptidase-like regulatory domain-containing protein [Roseiconus nitratireducens]KAA5540073.1 carboxypeptidase regulatory-like domain-containing protein [Roseiconus nitratireducens]